MWNKIIETHGKLSDLKAVWFPFIFLQLKPDQKMSYLHLLKMTFFFGLYFGSVFMLKVLWTKEPVSFGLWMEMNAKGWLGFFLWFNLVTRPLWNRRASVVEAQR